MLLMPACTVVSDKQYKEMIESNSQVYTKTEINNCYSALLHRIWIDHPSYVEDVLSSTDEYKRLSFILDGDFEDIFDFWNTGDSIDYHWNKEIEEMYSSNILRHRCNLEPDTLLGDRTCR